MKAIGYVRVSTQEQKRATMSLEAQEDKIRKYAHLHNLSLMEVVRDEEKSGEDLDREGMQEVMALCEKGEVDHLIVYKMDRLARNILDLLVLMERTLKPNKVQLHSVSERVDTSSAQGKFFLMIIGVMPQIGLALGVIFCVIWWFFATVGLGIMALLGKAKSEKRGKTVVQGLCQDCWLSGDCEREKKAGRSGEMVTSCRGYLPKNKSNESTKEPASTP